MKLEPWQDELLTRIDKDATIILARQSGRSDWYRLFQQFMNQPKKRFQVAGPVEGITSHLLVIEDYMWWTDNERAILNWMADNLPRGIEHQQGMILTFDTEQDRMMFLLRWA